MAMPLSLSTASLQFSSSSSSRPTSSPNQSLSSTTSFFTPSLSLDYTARTISISSRPSIIPVTCGRGDRKTKKGKRFIQSYGNARPRNKSKGTGPARAPTPVNPYKKVYVSPPDLDGSDENVSDAIPDKSK